MRFLMRGLVAACIGSTACAVGQNAAQWPVATTAAGATVKVVATTGTMIAELLEVTSDGVVVLRRDDRKIVFAPYRLLKQLEVEGAGSEYRMRGSIGPQPQMRTRLAAVSHFPQGMTPEIRAKLLARTGQTEILILQ